MKYSFVFLFIAVLILPGCIIYPRMSRIYMTPEYKAIVIDQAGRPVSGIIATFEQENAQQPSDTTTSDGTIYLAPKRKFVAFDFIVMDPAMYITATIKPADIHSKINPFERRFNFCYYSKRITTITDTIVIK
ncbi:Ig-like domain-containing protein [Hymenobacter sp. J193]|uniref:Ig-like domain-containing protein n=1 Tax=Hymenobacter sp. J193 TaxID=2898429 RepID=UPI0021519138|nr:Ig-like domain-containing protein [Hymenobacter sp. J193]MCR5889347.1 Ig-like domain-containing protein [Hymenobacter sp. J193]